MFQSIFTSGLAQITHIETKIERNLLTATIDKSDLNKLKSKSVVEKKLMNWSDISLNWVNVFRLISIKHYCLTS